MNFVRCAQDIHPYFWRKLAGAPVTWDDFTVCTLLLDPNP